MKQRKVKVLLLPSPFPQSIPFSRLHLCRRRQDRPVRRCERRPVGIRRDGRETAAGRVDRRWEGRFRHRGRREHTVNGAGGEQTATAKVSPSFTDEDDPSFFGVRKGMGRWGYGAGPTVSTSPMGLIVDFLTSILIGKSEFSTNITKNEKFQRRLMMFLKEVINNFNNFQLVISTIHNKKLSLTSHNYQMLELLMSSLKKSISLFKNLFDAKKLT